MNRINQNRLTVALLGVLFAGAAVAQGTPSNFPDTQVKPKTCQDFLWNTDMLREHPRVVDACQEVVIVKGQPWARFAADFIRVESDGHVRFRVHDQRNRFVEEVTIRPVPGQVAYINDRATPFERLRTTDRVNLYAPEGQYGFVTQAGAPPEELAVWARSESTPAAPVQQQSQPLAPIEPRTQLAYQEPRAELPRTASLMPLLGLGGMLSLLGGIGLSLRRKF